ncbi:MAG: hypothetical protein ACSHX7_05310 [Luteolibacter sp.]
MGDFHFRPAVDGQVDVCGKNGDQKEDEAYGGGFPGFREKDAYAAYDFGCAGDDIE